MKINNNFVKRYKRATKNNTFSSVNRLHHKFVEELEKIPEKIFNKDFGARWRGKKVTIASDTLFQAIDEENHIKQIKNWLRMGKCQ